MAKIAVIDDARKIILEPRKFDLKKLGRSRTSGHCAFLLRSPQLEEELKEIFGRDGLCLKVFRRSSKGFKVEDFCWGPNNPVDRSLVEKTKIQNLCARCGLAPRVYAVIQIDYEGEERFAQVTDFLTGPLKELPQIPFTVLKDRFGLELNRWDGSAQPTNFKGGKLIDFESLVIVKDDYDRDRKLTEQLESVDHGTQYLDRLRVRAKPGRRAYEAVPELGIGGRRNFEHRTGMMKLDDVDFRGKTVLDIGCNLGVFSRMAWDRGAKRIVGVDCYTADAAYEIANWLGYWNLDFFEMVLPQDHELISKLSGIESFDIVFLLAMYRRVSGWAPWLAKLCKNVLYLEGHATLHPERRVEGYTRVVGKDFSRVEYLGNTTDDRTRVLLRYWKT